MRQIIPFLVLILLTSCSVSPSQNDIQTAIAKTQKALPTNTIESIPTPTQTSTPTILPLEDINLEGILLLSGDLPTDYVGQQIKSTMPSKFNALPKPNVIIQQGFRAGKFASDGIMILLYESPDDLSSSYELLKGILEKDANFSPLNDVGEKSIISDERNNLFTVTSVKMVFLRCQALVYIDLFSTSADKEDAINYALRVDNRLTPLICR
jgi:hypothetical protein